MTRADHLQEMAQDHFRQLAHLSVKTADAMDMGAHLAHMEKDAQLGQLAGKVRGAYKSFRLSRNPLYGLAGEQKELAKWMQQKGATPQYAGWLARQQVPAAATGTMTGGTGTALTRAAQLPKPQQSFATRPLSHFQRAGSPVGSVVPRSPTTAPIGTAPTLASNIGTAQTMASNLGTMPTLAGRAPTIGTMPTMAGQITGVGTAPTISTMRPMLKASSDLRASPRYIMHLIKVAERDPKLAYDLCKLARMDVRDIADIASRVVSGGAKAAKGKAVSGTVVKVSPGSQAIQAPTTPKTPKVRTPSREPIGPQLPEGRIPKGAVPSGEYSEAIGPRPTVGRRVSTAVSGAPGRVSKALGWAGKAGALGFGVGVPMALYAAPKTVAGVLQAPQQTAYRYGMGATRPWERSFQM